jgi:ribonuclease Z
MVELEAGPYHVRGISVGGVYTSLQVPELDVLLDAGIPIRSFAATDRIFLSHTHADHAGALPALLGIRGLIGKKRPKLFFPAELEPELREALRALEKLHHASMEIDAHPLSPGDEVPLGHGLAVRAFRTRHSIGSLGYQFLRRVQKLKPEFAHLPGPEIGRRRVAGEPLFDTVEQRELAYATDTRVEVLDENPSLFDTRVLVIECTYVDERRTVENAREYCHLHLDELLARAERFRNEQLVLMHFSQLYSPAEVREVVLRRLPPSLLGRVQVFAPEHGRWFG